MCYAEFASMIPVAGSAYTFTYTTVGEIMAWIIGWDLILEMLMAGSVISKYWGVYLNDFMRLMGWNANTNLTFGSFHIDIAPIIIVAFFTTLLVFGTKIGARVDGAMTVLKIAIVFFVVIVGFFYVKASNFTPFIPPSQPASTVEGSSAVTGVMTQPLWQFATGMTPSVYGVPGILSGAALVFFAFIGFDVVATASEETKNPHKNVPLGIGVGMLLIIVMYMLVAVVTTGMVSYADLAKQDSPSLATAFELVGADWAAKIISFGIVLGLATVVMVLLLGLTRIVFAMSRDGLLPRACPRPASMAPRPLCRSSSARWWRSWPPSSTSACSPTWSTSAPCPPSRWWPSPSRLCARSAPTCRAPSRCPAARGFRSSSPWPTSG